MEVGRRGVVFIINVQAIQQQASAASDLLQLLRGPFNENCLQVYIDQFIIMGNNAVMHAGRFDHRSTHLSSDRGVTPTLHASLLERTPLQSLPSPSPRKPVEGSLIAWGCPPVQLFYGEMPLSGDPPGHTIHLMLPKGTSPCFAYLLTYFGLKTGASHHDRRGLTITLERYPGKR